MEGLPPGPSPSWSEQRAEAVLQLSYSLCAAGRRAASILAKQRTKLQGKPRKPGVVSRAWAHAVPAKVQDAGAGQKQPAANSSHPSVKAHRPHHTPQLLQPLQPRPSPGCEWRPAEPTPSPPPFGLHLGLAALGMGVPSILPASIPMKLQSFTIHPPSADGLARPSTSTATGAAGRAAAAGTAAMAAGGAGRKQQVCPGLRSLYQGSINPTHLQQPAFDISDEPDESDAAGDQAAEADAAAVSQTSSAAGVATAMALGAGTALAQSIAINVAAGLAAGTAFAAAEGQPTSFITGTADFPAFHQPPPSAFAANHLAMNGSLLVTDAHTAANNSLVTNASVLLPAASGAPSAALDPTSQITWIDEAMEEI